MAESTQTPTTDDCIRAAAELLTQAREYRQELTAGHGLAGISMPPRIIQMTAEAAVWAQLAEVQATREHRAPSTEPRRP